MRIQFDDNALELASRSLFDRLVLLDCDKPDSTIADKLLALELIARRSEEAGGGHGKPG